MNKKSHILAILAGGGSLPARVALGAAGQGQAVHVVTFEGQPQPVGLPESVPVETFAIGKIGAILRHLKTTGTTHVCMAGHLKKPSLLGIKPDATGLKILLKAATFHDDALLRAITGALAENGFTVIAPQDVMPALIITAGRYGAKPTTAQTQDAALAAKALHKLGELDIGQAAIVHAGTIVGLEAVEGTDGLIERCAPLRGEGKKPMALLVKRAKAGQSKKADLPFVGINTLKNLNRHGYAGLFVQAGATLTDDIDAMQAYAKKHGLVFEAVA